MNDLWSNQDKSKDYYKALYHNAVKALELIEGEREAEVRTVKIEAPELTEAIFTFGRSIKRRRDPFENLFPKMRRIQ